MPHTVAQVLDPARHVQRPHVVAEVALDLAGDGRHGVRLEGVAARRVVVVHGLDQTEGRHLVQILQGLTAAPETDGDALGHRQPGRDQRVAQHPALGPVGQPGQAFEVPGRVGGVVVGVLLPGTDGTHRAHLPERGAGWTEPVGDGGSDHDRPAAAKRSPRTCLLSEALRIPFPAVRHSKPFLEFGEGNRRRAHGGKSSEFTA
ncbi:hypothetical protein GCM10023238_37580 [Streptomyces heliomycini]